MFMYSGTLIAIPATLGTNKVAGLAGWLDLRVSFSVMFKFLMFMGR